ncbi:UNVERIFIED_ORG: O-antigen/teichoic acid export membrane protein [Heyndrickxia coagulans]
MKNSIMRNFLNISGGTFITMFIGVITTPIITRLVEPDAYGSLSLFNMYASIGMLVLGLGFDQALLRYFYAEDTIEYKSLLFQKCLKYPLFFTITLFIILLIIWKITGHSFFNISFGIFVIFFLQVIGLIFNRLFFLLLRLQSKTKDYSILNILAKIIYVTFAFGLITTFKDNDYLLLIIATVVSNIVVTAVVIWKEKQFWINKYSMKSSNTIEMNKLFHYGIPFIFSYGITTLFQSIDKISLSYYCSIKDVGIFSSAMALVNIFAIIQTSFNTLWAPMAIEHYEKNPEDRTFYFKGNQIITITMFVFGCGLILCKDIFALLLGEKYRLASYILPFLIFNPIMYTISETTVIGISFAKKSKYNIYVALIACLCNFIGNTLLIPMLGVRGAAISTGVSYIIFFTARTLISNKFFYIDYKLKKFYFLTSIFLLYATYNTFNSSDILTLFGFLLILVIIYFLYQSTIKEVIKYLMYNLFKLSKQN